MKGCLGRILHGSPYRKYSFSSGKLMGGTPVREGNAHKNLQMTHTIPSRGSQSYPWPRRTNFGDLRCLFFLFSLQFGRVLSKDNTGEVYLGVSMALQRLIAMIVIVKLPADPTLVPPLSVTSEAIPVMCNSDDGSSREDFHRLRKEKLQGSDGWEVAWVGDPR